MRARVSELVSGGVAAPETTPGAGCGPLASSLRYGDYEIDREREPNAARYAGRWRFSHDAYDGPGDTRHGHADTIEECLERIDELEECAADRARERRQNLARPYCGECGDTGIEPEEVMLGVVRQGRWNEERQECAACPRCSECGVELRLHPQQTMECP